MRTLQSRTSLNYGTGRPTLREGWDYRGAAVVAKRPTDSFAGASAIRATPMTTSTADPIRNPVRWLAISNANIDIVTACAKLDHAAKAIRLRCAAGFRTAISRKIPSAT